MPRYEIIQPRDDADDQQIWTATVQFSDEDDGFPTLYVLDDDEFRYYQFRDESDRDEAVEVVGDGDEPTKAHVRRRVAARLDRILRVERLPNRKWLYIRSERQGKARWDCIYCPERLGGLMFQALRKRLRPRLKQGEARESIRSAAGGPLACLIVVWLVTMMVWAGANIAERPEQPREQGPVYRSKAERGAGRLGALLGPTVSLVLGGVATVGVLIWTGTVVAARPMKKVLCPPDTIVRGRRDDDADEDEPDDEPDPPARGRSAPRGAGKVASTMGIVALVLGVPALALGWLSVLRGLMAVFAALGLTFGIGGVVLAWTRRRRSLMLPAVGGGVSVLALVVTIVAMLVASKKPTDEPEVAAAGTGGEPATTKTNTAPPPARGETSPPPKAPNTTSAPITPATPATPVEPQTDWGQPSDRDGDCTITPRGTTLTIDVPATPHLLIDDQGNDNAPRVLHDVQGDFTVQVKVGGTIHPTTPGSVPNRVSFQAAGLVLWGDNDNYIRLVRSGQNRPAGFQPVVAFNQRANAKPAGGTAPVVPEQDLHLRLERRGAQFQAWYSPDGQQWTALKPLTGNYPPKVQVGVVALNSAQQPLSVRFEEFRLVR